MVAECPTFSMMRPFAGVAQCCMCLWNHFGQKKMLDCSMRRNVGNFRLGCSLHISYRSTASPYSRSNSRRNLAQQGRPRAKAGVGVGVGSESYSGQFQRHLPASMDSSRSKLSASLSSLRCLTSESVMGGSGQFSGKSKRGRSVVRSSDFLHKTPSTTSSSWL